MTKMIEYLSFLQLFTFIILEAAAYYIYSLIKKVEESSNDLLPEVSYDLPKSDVKGQKLMKCALT